MKHFRVFCGLSWPFSNWIAKWGYVLQVIAIPKNETLLRALVGAATLVFIVAPVWADEVNPHTPSNIATVHLVPDVVVIGNAPLPGLGLPLNHVPSNVQTTTADDLKRQRTLDLGDFLNNNFSGISVNDSQDNPLQTDVNYHGFTASPLLGTPEGLSVYVDGVRINEAFGDTVNWDLIPQFAISAVSLMSGSNPVFGLNTLGGALAVQTKSGRSSPGTELEASAGSFGRHAFEAATGGVGGNFDYFITGDFFKEDGWRDLSPSKARRVFGKAGWQDDKTHVHLSYSWADNRLIGNGAVPQSLLGYRRESIYSAPDFTGNRLNFVNLNLTHYLRNDLLLSANAYYRGLRTAQLNGDVNDDNYQSDDYAGPDIDCTVPATSAVDIAYCANGINRRSRLTQSTGGVGLQLTDTARLFGIDNQAVIGANFDRARVNYTQTLQYAALTADRATVAIADPFNSRQTSASVSGVSKSAGIYFSDTLSPSSLLHLTVSARYNRINETLGGYSVDTDLGDFGDGFGDAATLSGDHTYVRLNPSAGFTLTPNESLTFYANYSEGSRAPTVIELGCSDPAQPCGLPNDFASDPNLKQVVARTVEAGVRSTPRDGLNWSADIFRTQSSNDIQFIAASTSQGYFSNVGTTRRQGLDLSVGGALDRLHWHAVYSFVDATHRSGFGVGAESNSTADDGIIQVRTGNRIPLIPRHTGRLHLDYAVNTDWDIGGSVVASSGSFLHGNENNANQPAGQSGDDVIGSGRIAGYTVVNLESSYRIGKVLTVFLRAVNVFDRHYATAGFLTSNSFDANGAFRPDPDDWTNENSVSPAQPRAVWAGIQLRWD